jgi:hypothetical protein
VLLVLAGVAVALIGRRLRSRSGSRGYVDGALGRIQCNSDNCAARSERRLDGMRVRPWGLMRFTRILLHSLAAQIRFLIRGAGSNPDG